jgi:ABC-type antimicrobial peptide transport system permease subunit
MIQVIDEAEWVGRVSSRIVRFISMIAFAFSIIGLYAVTAHAVAARTNEIGVRMALGARPAHVRRIILGRAGMQVAMGLGLGILGTMAWSAAFFTGRIDARLANPDVIAPVAALLAAGTIGACLIPLRRAIRLDPVSTLRQE